MKKNTVKGIAAVIFVLVLMFTTMFTTYAETVQDDVENWLNGLVSDYESAETEEEKASLQEQLSDFLAQSGLDNMDLGALTETDIGQIVGGVTDGSALSGLFGLASDAFSSGMAMIQDVFNKGAGTSDGSNTATTNAKVTSPNQIIADTTKTQPSTQAVGIAIPESTRPAEITTYDVGATTAPAPVGSGITTTMPATNPVVADEGVATSSVAVFAVLAAATLGVIIAIMVFFVLKRK